MGAWLESGIITQLLLGLGKYGGTIFDSSRSKHPPREQTHQKPPRVPPKETDRE